MLSALSQLIFGSRFDQSESKKSLQWRERSLYFDLGQSDLQLTKGEQLISCFYPIEDIKGNPDNFGVLKVTNLRLIWICCDKKRINLSIGWRTVLLSFQQNMRNSLGVPNTTLCILTNFESIKYEFIFRRMTDSLIDYLDFDGSLETIKELESFNEFFESNLFHQNVIKLANNHKPCQITHLSPMNDSNFDPFDCVFKVWQAYKRTTNFRQYLSNVELAQQPNDSTQQQLQQITTLPIESLPSEQIVFIYMDLIQVEKSRLGKKTGILFVTNIRLVWINEIASMRAKNLSIPFLQSKFSNFLCALCVF